MIYLNSTSSVSVSSEVEVFQTLLAVPHLSKVAVAEMFCEKDVLENFANHRCFPVNFAKFSRTPFFIEHLWWLLLKR